MKPPPHPPPWTPHAHHPRRHGKPPWGTRRQRLFWRFAAWFGFMALLFTAGVGGVVFLLNLLFRDYGHTALLVWVAGCGLSLALPLVALSMGRRAFRGIATPLADVMAAAEAIAEGDLSVRVTAAPRGEFSHLARSFNHMAAELERADQQRRNLTADVAHELRTPLHIIQGNLEGILDGVYEPTPAHIGDTLEETHLLARLVDDLHTLSLAEAGQLPLHWEKVDVAALLADVVTSFSGQAEHDGVSLWLLVPEEGALWLRGDVGRLDQVLGNLMVNALRHTPAGGTITLAAEQQGEMVVLRVRDTGEGIAAADLPFIFDRFWRGDKARQRGGVPSGGGLGLAITRQLVRAHGGTIEAQSEPGQGTTFVLEFPLDAREA